MRKALILKPRNSEQYRFICCLKDLYSMSHIMIFIGGFKTRFKSCNPVTNKHYNFFFELIICICICIRTDSKFYYSTIICIRLSGKFYYPGIICIRLFCKFYYPCIPRSAGTNALAHLKNEYCAISNMVYNLFFFFNCIIFWPKVRPFGWNYPLFKD